MILAAVGSLIIGICIGMIIEVNRWVRLTKTKKFREINGELYIVKNITEQVQGRGPSYGPELKRQNQENRGPGWK